jgi:hypothetical protein
MDETGGAEVIRLRADGLVWRKVGDELVILDSVNSRYLSINGSGAELWEALSRGCTRDALVDLLATSHSLDYGRAGEDVDHFLRDLGEQDLLQRHLAR